MVFLFHIVNADGPNLLGLKTLRHIEIFNKHPRVYNETIDFHSINLAQASKQPKEREDSQNLSEYQNTVSEVSKVGIAACPTPTEKFQAPAQVNDDVVHANAHLDLSD